MKTLLIALSLSAFCFAQEARIMIVEKQDSEHLNSAYKDYQAAKKRWEDVKSYVAKKYTAPDGSKVIEGWEKVQFSADFRAIVPESSQFATTHTGCLYGWNSWPSTNTVATGLSTSNSVLQSNGTAAAWVDPSELKVNGDGVATELTTKEPKRP